MSPRSVLLSAVLLAACSTGALPPGSRPRGAGASPIEVTGRWAASRWVLPGRLQITVFGPGGAVALTRGHRDYKPVWNPRGDQLAFFRASADAGGFETWKAALMVVDAEGKGERQLTSGEGRDFNPTWTRDGSNRILFNRYAPGGDARRCEVHVTSPDGKPGSEVRVSDAAHGWEWADAGLKDGRVFVDTIGPRRTGPGGGAPFGLEMRSWLLTPRPGGGGTYEEVARPTEMPWHKLSVSPSETKVVYMLDTTWNIADYRDDLLYWAEFDRDRRVVKNPVRITGPTDLRCINEYPRWSADEQLILFDSSCDGYPRVYAYRLADGATAPVPTPSFGPVMFASVQGVPP